MSTTPLSNAEKCRRRRQKLIAEDPERYKREQQRNRERQRLNRSKPKTDEELQRRRQLGLERQKRYLEKKKMKAAAQAAEGIPPPRQTRLDVEKAKKRRTANTKAVQKHRANQHPQKRRRLNKKRMDYYYLKKMEKAAAVQKLNEKSVQAEITLNKVDCPYPTPEAHRRAVQWVKTKLGPLDPSRFAHMIRGVIKHSSKKTKVALKKLNVIYHSPCKSAPPTASETLKNTISDLAEKKDIESLTFKRNLAKAFNNAECAAEVGLSKRYVKSCQKAGPVYRRKKIFRLRADVLAFYDEHAVPNPCRSSKKRQLLVSVKELHKDFVAHHPDKKVSLRTFHKLKPQDVASVRKLKFRQCMCELCVNPKLKLQGLNALMSRKFESVRDLLTATVCDFDVTPRLECIDRKCSDCGVGRVRERLENELRESLNERVYWKRWEHVKDGKSSRMDKVKKSGTVKDCVEELVSELGGLYRHVFNAEWQRRQLQMLKSDLPEGWVLVYLDFAENFLCKFQNEVQSAHWAYKQVTLFPSVIFYKCPVCSKLRRDEVAYLADDLQKDASMSQMFIDDILKRLFERMGDGLKKVILVSDGCAAQFKSKLPFLLLSHTHAGSGSHEVSVERVFFGSRHGKNDCDWSGGAIKRVITRDLASGRVSVRNARDMFQHCAETLAFGSAIITDKCEHKTRQFELLDKAVNRKVKSSSVATVPGSRKLHHVRPLAPLVLAVRQLSCFCSHCRVEDWENCESVSHVGAWDNVKLRYSGPDLSPPTPFPPIPTSESDDEDDEDVPVVEVLSDSSSCSADLVESDSEWEESNQSDLGDLPPCPEDTDVRLQFFERARETLASCEDFVAVRARSEMLLEEMQQFAFPEPSRGRLVGCPVDAVSSELLSEELKGRCTPLSVRADGNCFFRALSLLVFGTERHHAEFRVRCAVTMASFPYLFLDGRNWCAEHEEINHQEVINIALMTSAQFHGSAELTFQAEVLSLVKNGSYTGLFEIFAAAQVLQRPVQSIFPARGEQSYRLHCNRIIRPPNCCHDEKLHIMWTSLERPEQDLQTWSPDHFVPIVLRLVEEPPRRGNFHLLVRNGKDFLGQVLETDKLNGQACVKFMTKLKGYYVWPVIDDFSWEPCTSFVREVEVEFVEGMSNNRCQMFRIKSV